MRFRVPVLRESSGAVREDDFPLRDTSFLAINLKNV
jgi:hypothetical protein